jgi:hypothetical protein
VAGKFIEGADSLFQLAIQIPLKAQFITPSNIGTTTAEG